MKRMLGLAKGGMSCGQLVQTRVTPSKVSVGRGFGGVPRVRSVSYQRILRPGWREAWVAIQLGSGGCGMAMRRVSLLRPGDEGGLGREPMVLLLERADCPDL